MTVQITEFDIREITTSPKGSIVKGIVENQHLIGEGGIEMALQLCHFIAQLAHESAHFRTTLEFASGEAYEGRKDLGNIQQGDGRRYRGRGLIQTTGRANYQEATRDIQNLVPGAPDFEADPKALEEFPWALLSAVSYWRRRNINRHADRDDIESVTRAINGGVNGLPDRRRYLRRTKGLWLDGPRITDANPTLRRGDTGNAVRDLQSLLTGVGFGVLIDGDFGKHTADALKAFQKSRGLKADGVAGPVTWDALHLRSD